MHENFIELDTEKRDRIINAAMREFAAKGFKNASTNEIVKNAHISKGALFHYFSSKKDLFDFLYRYGVNFLMESTKPHIKNLPPDIFERWSAFAALKIEIAAQYPDMAAFMQSAYREDAQEAGNMLKNEYDKYSMSFQQLIYQGIDTSKFAPGVDIKKAQQIIWWVLEGYALSLLKKPFDVSMIKNPDFLHDLTSEMQEYLTLLKHSLYKDEFRL